MRDIKFSADAFTQYKEWSENDTNIFAKINELIIEVCREPFKGKGKPEPLKGNFSGYWSRRITKEHRLIYKVDKDTVYIAQCYGHYE
jgi:toxin YoeB